MLWFMWSWIIYLKKLSSGFQKLSRGILDFEQFSKLEKHHFQIPKIGV